MKASLAEQQTEILAPAGCYASLQAAIDAGANAVYFGLAQLKIDNNYVFSPNDIATIEFLDQVLGDLKKVYNRGHSSGYYLGRPQGWSAAYGSKATHQKILGGEVSHYYPKIGVAEIHALREIAAGKEFLIIGR